MLQKHGITRISPMKGAANDTNEASPTPTRIRQKIRTGNEGAIAQPRQASVQIPIPKASKRNALHVLQASAKTGELMRSPT